MTKAELLRQLEGVPDDAYILTSDNIDITRVTPIQDVDGPVWAVCLEDDPNEDEP